MAADHSWRWKTSNAEYGKFYVSIHKEVTRSENIHKSCKRKVITLGEELCEAKACLEMLRRGLPPHGNGYGPGGAKVPEIPQHVDFECSRKPPTECGNELRSACVGGYNGGRKHEPEFLEDHIKCYHPRLVKRLTPKLPFAELYKSVPDFGGKGAHNDSMMMGDSFSAEGPKARHSSGGYYRRASSGGLGGMVDASSPSSSPRRRVELPTVPVPVVLPPSQRYNFYRYYGFAGQGAKTSKGWHTKA